MSHHLHRRRKFQPRPPHQMNRKGIRRETEEENSEQNFKNNNIRMIQNMGNSHSSHSSPLSPSLSSSLSTASPLFLPSSPLPSFLSPSSRWSLNFLATDDEKDKNNNNNNNNNPSINETKDNDNKDKDNHTDEPNDQNNDPHYPDHLSLSGDHSSTSTSLSSLSDEKEKGNVNENHSVVSPSGSETNSESWSSSSSSSSSSSLSPDPSSSSSSSSLSPSPPLSLYSDSSLLIGQYWISLLHPSSLQEKFSPNLYLKLHSSPSLSTVDSHIKKDVNRTFPSHPLFSSHSKYNLQNSLLNVLRAYSQYDPSVSYSQGLGFIVGFLLIHIQNEEIAFWSFVVMMFNEPMEMRRLYDDENCAGIKEILHVIDESIREFPPTSPIGKHLSALNIDSSLYATQCIVTLFCYRCPLDFTRSVWNLFFKGGMRALISIQISLLEAIQSTIHKMNFDEIVPFLTNIPLEYMRTEVVEKAESDRELHQIIEKNMRKFKENEKEREKEKEKKLGGKSMRTVGSSSLSSSASVGQGQRQRQGQGQKNNPIGAKSSSNGNPKRNGV